MVGATRRKVANQMALRWCVPNVRLQIQPGAYAHARPPCETTDFVPEPPEFSVEVYGAGKKNGRRPLYRFNENTTLKEMWEALVDHRR
jgi:hypothetical protein